jgi:hypothetical protein
MSSSTFRVDIPVGYIGPPPTQPMYPQLTPRQHAHPHASSPMVTSGLESDAREFRQLLRQVELMNQTMIDLNQTVHEQSAQMVVLEDYIQTNQHHVVQTDKNLVDIKAVMDSNSRWATVDFVVTQVAPAVGAGLLLLTGSKAMMGLPLMLMASRWALRGLSSDK